MYLAKKSVKPIIINFPLLHVNTYTYLILNNNVLNVLFIFIFINFSFSSPFPFKPRLCFIEGIINSVMKTICLPVTRYKSRIPRFPIRAQDIPLQCI